MKKFKSMLAIMMAMVCAVSFVSCGDDDDDNNSSNNGSNNGGSEEVSGIAKTIEGEYMGNETITVMGSGDTETATYKVEATGASTITIIIPGGGGGAMSYPDLPVEGLSVASDGTFSGEYAGSVTKEDGSIRAYSCTMSGKYVDGVLTVDGSLKYGNMPMAMVIKFEGQKGAQNVVAESVSKKVSGKYNGTDSLTISVMGQSIKLGVVSYEVSVVDDTLVSLSAPAANYSGMSLPALTIDSVVVSGSNDSYTLTKDDFKSTITVDGVEKNYSISNFSVNVKDKDITVKYDLTYGSMPMAMSYDFVGSKAE